jgi:feruloyl esterase
MRSLPARRRRVTAAVLALAGALLGLAAAAAPPATAGGTPRPVRACADLVGEYGIPGAATTVTAATVVPAAGSQPEHCDVRGHVAPAVGFQLELPTRTYSGRYVQYGCQGLCGTILLPGFPAAASACGAPPGGDFAIAATDDGHASPGQFPLPLFDGTWAANDQSARDDYFSRAPHVLAAAARRLITTYYGAPPRHSYFDGCSTGGREGLLLAQRYPHDFEGIIAGAPANVMAPLMGVYFTWLARANANPDGSPILTLDKLPALHRAVLAGCDGLDGLVDGQIDDPRTCHVDPGTLRCPAGVDRADCLTPAQVDATRRLYTGPVDADGTRLYPGWELPGSELAWRGSVIPDPQFGSILPLPDNYLRYLGYPIGAPASSVATFPFTVAELNRLEIEGVKGNATSLDLRAFHRAGGRLILWHGFDDQSIPAIGTLDYYQRLWEHAGGLRQTRTWARLFVVPTLYHCETGGDVLTEFDPLPALVDWVERGHAADRVVADRRDPNGNVTRTRPVFAYPTRAVYRGSGSIDDAANFRSAPPLAPQHDIVPWAGDHLYTP